MTDEYVKQMNPMSGESIEVDGVYANEWGRQAMLHKGDIFPSDPMMGTTEWELVSLPVDHETKRKTVDPEVRKESSESEPNKTGLRRHIVRQDG